jgi:hypothetical protein
MMMDDDDDDDDLIRQQAPEVGSGERGDRGDL